jgi:glucose-6-phosphate isomerase
LEARNDIAEDVRDVLDRMSRFAESIRSARGPRRHGKPISDVVTSASAAPIWVRPWRVLALAPYHDGPRAHFVSNVDGPISPIR